MLRITKVADYGVVLLTRMAAEPQRAVFPARDLATATHLPLPMVSKVLKALAGKGLLKTHRGVKGGYALARDPDGLSVAEVIGALDGPVALTDCAAGGAHDCHAFNGCPARSTWARVNKIVRQSLENVSLTEFAAPLREQILEEAK